MSAFDPLDTLTVLLVMQSFCYTRHQTKETLIDFLVRRFPYQTRENWIKSIESGAIRVNEKKTIPSFVLSSKDVISYDRPRSEEPEVDTRYRILYLDQYILVVEKNGNIPIAESGRYYRNTLINILKEKEGFSELYAVHRLDKETSGVLLISRQKEIATRLGVQFANQVPKKTYHAILRGELTCDERLVDQPIKRCSTEQSKIRIRQVVDDQGKPSKTLFRKIAANNYLTLSEIQTFSGRTHQIRCHAEYIGYPLLGDKLYGQDDDDFLDFLNEKRRPEFESYGSLSRQLLHASSLSFDHPETGQEMSFQSDYYEEFSRFSKVKEWLDANIDR